MKPRMAGYTATGQSTNGSGSGCARSLSEPTSPTTVRIICGITIYPQQSEDPDLSLSAPFPITKDSFTRKAIRDLTGQTFVNQRLPLLLSLFRRKGADDTESDESFPFSHARTTLAGPIERLLIAPYWVNFHAEHHLFMYLPCYRLPEAHRLLVEKGFIERMEVRPGYLEVMRLATSSQRV